MKDLIELKTQHNKVTDLITDTTRLRDIYSADATIVIAMEDALRSFRKLDHKLKRDITATELLQKEQEQH